MKIPDCYDPANQEEARDLAYTAKLLRRPRCCKCGGYLAAETCLDLTDFGLPDSFACERCMGAATIDVSVLDTED